MTRSATDDWPGRRPQRSGLVRIVITGATGNVGSALVRRLLADGGHELVGLARRLPERGRPPFDAVDWRTADLTTDAALPVLRDAFRGAAAVVHLAWGFQPSHDEAYLEALGVGGTRRVLRALTTRRSRTWSTCPPSARTRRSVTTSRSTRAGPPAVCRALPYSRHKAAAERLLDEHEAGGSGTVVTRTAARHRRAVVRRERPPPLRRARPRPGTGPRPPSAAAPRPPA